MLLLNKNLLIPIGVKMNTIYMFIYFYFLVLIYKILNNLMFSTNMIQECSKWCGEGNGVSPIPICVFIRFQDTDKHRGKSCKHREKTAVYQPRKEASEEINSDF